MKFSLPSFLRRGGHSTGEQPGANGTAGTSQEGTEGQGRTSQPGASRGAAGGAGYGGGPSEGTVSGTGDPGAHAAESGQGVPRPPGARG